MTDRRSQAIEGLKAMAAMLDRIDWSLFEECSCGHFRVEHRRTSVNPEHKDGERWSCGHGDYDFRAQRAVCCSCRDFEPVRLRRVA